MKKKHIRTYVYVYICHPSRTIYIYARNNRQISFIYTFPCIIPLAFPSMTPFQHTLEGLWFFSYVLSSSIHHYWIFLSDFKQAHFFHLKNKAKQTSEATKTYLSSHWALAYHLISQLLNEEESAFSVQTYSHTIVHFLTSSVNNMP